MLIGTFLFMFLKTLNAPEILLGITVTMTVVVEIPLFQMSKKLHEKFTDRQLLSAAMLTWCVRVVGYSLLTNPWYVLILEPLHGFTFGLMWLAGVHFTRAQFPLHLAATAFGFLHASVWGAGPVLGNIGGGVMYNYLGPRLMFQVAAACMFLAVIAFNVLDRRFERMISEGGGGRGVDGVIVESPLPVRNSNSSSSNIEGCSVANGIEPLGGSATTTEVVRSFHPLGKESPRCEEDYEIAQRLS